MASRGSRATHDTGSNKAVAESPSLHEGSTYSSFLLDPLGIRGIVSNSRVVWGGAGGMVLVLGELGLGSKQDDHISRIGEKLWAFRPMLSAGRHEADGTRGEKK